MKKVVIMVMAFAFVFSVILVAMDNNSMAEEKANSRKGKYLFKSKCKECHWKDKEGGEVTPITYTQNQWESFFDKGRYHRKMDIIGIDEKFTAEEMRDIRQYLIEHAADSPHPETCG